MYTPETVLCRPIDMEKLNKHIDTIFDTDPKFKAKNTRWMLHGHLAVVYKPVLALMYNDEFCGELFKTVRSPIDLQVYTASRRKSKGRGWFSAMPKAMMRSNIQSLEKFMLPEMTLAEFTKGRRGYNSRIVCKQRKPTRNV